MSARVRHLPLPASLAPSPRFTVHSIRCFSPTTHQHRVLTTFSRSFAWRHYSVVLPFKILAQLRTLQLALASCDSSSPSTGKLHSARSWSRVTARSWNIWYWDRRERIRSATMASQAALISETIAGMKKAVKRKAYGMLHPRSILRTPLLISAQTIDSDSDASIDQLTNRGNKLRKKARYVHEGQLAPPSGPQVYKRVRYRFQTTPGLALMHDTENRIRRISSRDHRSESSSCRRRWLRSR